MMFGLLGKKLIHSFSPFIHNSLCTNIDYSLIEVEEDKIENFFKEKQFSALNVTTPYKESSIRYLNEIDPLAKRIGAVNLIVNENGLLKGYNTDYYGFKETLKKNNINVKNKKCLILGTGGTSKTVKTALIDLGAKLIYLVSRSKKKDALTYEEAEKIFDIDYIFNTTPYGMYPNNTEERLINLDKFPYLLGVGDVIFNPFCTRLLFDAKLRKIKNFNGLYMLVKQAELSEFIIGNRIVKSAEKVYKELISKTGNIILIGMPFSGKTTAGKNLARRLKLTHIDLDKKIEENIGMTIPEYFEKHTEAEFRQVESFAIEEVSNKKGVVVSCGGGTILRESNMRKLLENGFCVFLNKKLELLKEKANSKTRPLLKTKTIEQIYEERIDLYLKYTDITINNNGSKEDTLNQLLKEFMGYENKNY